MKTLCRFALTILLPLSQAASVAAEPLKDVLTARERSLIPLLSQADRAAYGGPEGAMNAEATDALLGTWRGKIRAAALTVAAANPADETAQNGSARIGSPLAEYFDSRFALAAAATAGLRDKFTAFWAQVDGHDDAAAKASFYNNVRALIRADAEAYHAGDDGDEKLVLWFNAVAADPGSANTAAETLLRPAPPTAATTLQEKVDAAFTSAVSRAVAMLQLGKLPGGAAAFFEHAGALEPAQQDQVIDGLKTDVHGLLSAYVASDGAEPADVKAAVEGAGKTLADVLAYYCPVHAAAAQGAERRPTLQEQLRRFNVESIAAAQASGDAESRERADPIRAHSDAVTQKCAARGRLSAPRRPPLTLESNPEHAGLGTTEPPEPGAGQAQAAPDKEEAAEEEEGSSIPWKKMAVGAAGGAIGFGFIGFLLGGPIGALIGGAIGAAFMGGVTWFINS